MCRLETCQGEGGGELAKAIEECVGTRFDKPLASGVISLESLECIGLCGMSYAVTIDDKPVVGWDTVLRAVDDLLP